MNTVGLWEADAHQKKSAAKVEKEEKSSHEIQEKKRKFGNIPLQRHPHKHKKNTTPQEKKSKSMLEMVAQENLKIIGVQKNTHTAG